MAAWIFYLLVLFLPTQLGYHFWPDWAFNKGLRVDYLSPTFHFTDLLVLGMLVAGRFPRITLSNKLLLLMVFVIINIATSVSWQVSAFKWLKIVEMGYLALWLKENFRYLDKGKVYTCFFAGLITEVLLVFAQILHQGSLGGIFYWLGERAINAVTIGAARAATVFGLVYRPYGTFSHPNVLAGYLVIVSAILFYVYRRGRQILMLFTPLVIMALIPAVSRSAILALVLAVSAELIFLLRKKSFALREYFLPMGLFWIGLVIVMLAMVFGADVNMAFFSRWDQVKFVFSQPLIRYFFGWGLGSSAIIGYSVGGQPIHNLPLLLLLETGLVGLSAIVYNFKKFFVEKRWVGLRIIYFVLAMFDHYLLTSQQGLLLSAVIFGITFLRKE